MLTNSIEIKGINYIIKVCYESRNNSTASIGKGFINIRIPSFLNRDEKARQLFEMRQWAVNKIIKNKDRFIPPVQKEYNDGDILKVGDEDYTLRIDYRCKQGSSARIKDNLIELAISGNLPEQRKKEHISTLISRCIARKRLPNLHERIHELNNKHFNQKINRIFFKNTISRWGSCSVKGNINISTRLLFAPDDVLEYVCLHELAHLVEQNHSERFWALVGKSMPDYKEKMNWLKENGHKCTF